jgi:hypothetical protein
MCIHIVSQFAIKPVYTTLNNYNFVIHLTDMYLTIQIQHNTLVYLTLNFHPKGESVALTKIFHIQTSKLVPPPPNLLGHGINEGEQRFAEAGRHGGRAGFQGHVATRSLTQRLGDEAIAHVLKHLRYYLVTETTQLKHLRYYLVK